MSKEKTESYLDQKNNKFSKNLLNEASNFLTEIPKRIDIEKIKLDSETVKNINETQKEEEEKNIFHLKEFSLSLHEEQKECREECYDSERQSKIIETISSKDTFLKSIDYEMTGNNRFLDIINKNKDNSSQNNDEKNKAIKELEDYKNEFYRKRKKTKKEAMEEIKAESGLDQEFMKLKKRLGVIGESGSGYLPVKLEKRKRKKYLFSSS